MVGRQFVTILIVALFFSSWSFAVSDDEKAQEVLKKAADTLGWPDTIISSQDKSDSSSGENIGTGRSYTISENGKGTGDDLHASIAVFTLDQEASFWMSFIDQELDVVHSSYQGRDAEISTYGQNCNPKPLVKAINDWVNGFFESIFGPSDQPDNGCVTDHGAIMWTCGKYIFVGADDTSDSGGEENTIAAAVYSAAQQAGLCDYGDTLVIMADTPDRNGNKELKDMEMMTQRVNQYYGVNSMGQQPPFKFSFLSAAKAPGDSEWFTLDNNLASYPYMGDRPFATDAIKKAFDGSALTEDLYFERIVVVYPGDGHQNDPTSNFANACSYLGPNAYTEVKTLQGTRKIYARSLIYLSENRELGGWVHEFGHSLASKYMNGQFAHISDRYNYDATTDPDRQFGDSSKWDLMASGSHWGPDDGSTPTQMASYTKYAAGWLSYKYAALNTSYTLTALENMKAGDAELRVDDPTSTNAEEYLIIEARDATASFGAPASGVVLYGVDWDSSYNHHVVNDWTTLTGQTEIRTANGRYDTPTLYSADPSPGSTYDIVPWQLKVTVTSITRQPFAATVKVVNYDPTNLAGATLHPGPVPTTGVADGSTSENALDNDTMPGMDLEAYDSAGNHVGINPQTGDFENNIPGAIASGPRTGADEWIFVPAGTQVRYDVSTYRTQKFLADHPEAAATDTQQGFNATAIKFDSSGNRFEAPLATGNAAAGATVPITSPDDPSVKYQPATIPGVGNNSNQLCPFLPAFLLLLLGGFLWKGRQ